MRKFIVIGAGAALAAAVFASIPTIELHAALRGGGANPEHPTIVMLGDSHTHFVNWPLLLHCDGIANAGIGGQTSAQIRVRLPDVIKQHPRLVVLMAGTNDALQHADKGGTLQNLQEMQSEIESSGAAFASVSPPPLPVNRAGIEPAIEWASIKVPFDDSDLLPDQIHLRASGYAKWRDAIAPLVKRYCVP